MEKRTLAILGILLAILAGWGAFSIFSHSNTLPIVPEISDPITYVSQEGYTITIGCRDNCGMTNVLPPPTPTNIPVRTYAPDARLFPSSAKTTSCITNDMIYADLWNASGTLASGAVCETTDTQSITVGRQGLPPDGSGLVYRSIARFNINAQDSAQDLTLMVHVLFSSFADDKPQTITVSTSPFETKPVATFTVSTSQVGYDIAVPLPVSVLNYGDIVVLELRDLNETIPPPNGIPGDKSSILSTMNNIMLITR